MDNDLLTMNEAELRVEVAKLRETIRYHRDQKGDDNCWLDNKVLYNALPEKIDASPELPDKQLMMINCSKYYDCRKAGKLYAALEELPKKIEFAYDWINVKDRLPPFDIPVVVINADGWKQCIAYNETYNELCMTRIDEGEEFKDGRKVIYREVPFTITHWYPLPWWPNVEGNKNETF